MSDGILTRAEAGEKPWRRVVKMVKGTQNIRTFFQSKESPTKPMLKTSPARPPLSSFSASARNNLCAGSNSPPAQPAVKSQPKLDGRSPQVKSREGIRGQVSHPLLENIDSKVGTSSNNSSSPERFSTPCGTPLNSKSRRSSGVRRLPFSSTDLENVQGHNSQGPFNECLARTKSNKRLRATSSEDGNTTMDDSDPTSTSGSEVDNLFNSRPSPARRQSSVCLSRQSPARQEGLRRMSLGPKIEAAVSKLEKTPTKPARPVRNVTPCASPCSLRASAQRALVLQDQHQAQTHYDLEENPSFWDDHNVQVVIRTRPTSGKEVAQQDFSRCLRQEGPHTITWLGQPETLFTFDHVAGENISQEELFKVVGLPIVENCMAGYNSCMFAYGQTGSGKTHTMLGDITSLGDRPNDKRGMTPRIFEYLFSRIQKEEEDRQIEQLRYVCKCSFLEIYNEQITDLLEPTSSNLQMREDSKKGVYVENLTEKAVDCVQDVVMLLLKGASNRKVASTNMNRESSRSHSVFTCIIESKWMTNGAGNKRFGRLNLVDLAGSERQKSSGAEGERLKEAASINKSLSTLGLVIMTLVDMANGKPRHIPYRDSKLTYLLQDSLGGNSKTAIIATISPSSCCSLETLSTLKFAQRAKFIQNNAVVNEDASGEVQALRHEIQELMEEVTRLRAQTLSTMQRECRRASNEFFRMSLTGRELFNSAEKDHADEGWDLKSAELLGKVKALEAVLAGALRREQVAESVAEQQADEIQRANKLVEDRESEVRNCKSLVCLNDDGSARYQTSEDSESSDVMLAERAKSLEHESKVSKLELENFRLTEQLHRYQSFFDSGEREVMAAEIQGLRDQVLESLDAKIAVERGVLSTTIAQGDNYRRELETCRNDLTNCLEASSQLQRQVGELQNLVNQLNEQSADKERELKQMKESAEKYAKVKEEEINLLRTGWENATAKLYRDLMEGERALSDAGQEMAEIMCEDWLPKNTIDIPARWSLESLRSQKEVDIEHDYFKGRDSCTSDDIFGERKTSRRKRSFGVTSRVSIVTEEKLKLEANVARLERELEEQKQRIINEERIQEELDRVVKENLRLIAETENLAKISGNTSELLQEIGELRAEVQHLRVKLHERNDAIEASRAQISALHDDLAELEKVKLDQEEALALKSQEASDVQEKNLDLLKENYLLSLRLKDTRIKAEETEAALVDLARANDELLEESGLLKLQAEKDEILQACMKSKVSDLEMKLKLQQEEISELETEIERLELVLHEAECRQQQLEITVQDDKETILVLEEEKVQLQSALKIISLKLTSTDTVQEELRVTVSSLHQELEKNTTRKDAVETQEKSKSNVCDQERFGSVHHKSCQMLIGVLEASLAEKSRFLESSEEALSSFIATSDALKMERDAAQAQADLAQAETISSRAQIQVLQENLYLISTELEILSEMMQSVITEKNLIPDVNFQRMSHTLSQELEQERATLRAQQHELPSLTSTLEQRQVDLFESKSKEKNLLAELLSLKDRLHRSECTVRLKRETESRLQGEKSALTEILKSKKLESDCLKQELAASQELLLEHQRKLAVMQSKIESDAQAIALSKETIEQLQTKLQQKEVVLKVFASDLSFIQECALKDCDIKQEYTKANARFRELQEVALTRCEELDELDSAKHDVTEQLALNAAAKKLVEDRMLETKKRVAFLTVENEGLSSRFSQLQTETIDLKTVLAEKNEAISSLEAELKVAMGDTSRTTEALLALQGDMQIITAERDDSKTEFSTVVTRLDNLQQDASQKVAEVEDLHGELLVSLMTECCLKQLISDLEANAAHLEAQKAVLDAELVHINENMKQLRSECLRTSETADQLNQEKVSLEASIAEMQADRASLSSQLVQRSESESVLQDHIVAMSTSADLSLAEIVKLKSQVEKLQSMNCRLEKDLGLKIGEVSSLSAEVIAARNLTAQSLDQVDKMRSRISALEEKHRDMEFDIALENGAVNTAAAELSAAQAATCSMAQDLEDLNQRIAALISEKDALEESVSQKDEALSSKDAELQAVKGSLDSLDSSFRSKLTELQLQRRNDEDDLQTARKNQNSLQDEIHCLALRLADSERSNNSLKLELAENITAMSSLQDRISIASRSFSYSQEEMKSMKAEIGELLNERDGLQAELNLRNATITNLEKELVGLRASAGSSRDSIAALEAKVVTLQAERDTIDKQITELEVDVIANLQFELTEAQESLKSLDNEMAEARRVSDYVSKENSALQARIVVLEAEKGTFEAEILCKSTQIMSLESELAAANSSSMALREELRIFEAQVLELQNLKASLEIEVAERKSSISLLEYELLSAMTVTSSDAQEDDKLKMQIKSWQEKCSSVETQLADANQELHKMKAQINQQELQLSSLEELLAQKAEALQHMVSKAVHATQEFESVRSEVEGLKELLRTKEASLQEKEKVLKNLEISMSPIGNESDELRAVKDERDQALVQVQALHGEVRAAQALMASHKSSVLEAQKFAEVNILRASAKEEEARTLKASVSALKNQNSTLEKQLEATKREADILRKARDEFEMELQGMKNRMTMLQAVHSTGSRNFKGFQAAQAASLDLQKTLEEKEAEVSQMYKRMTVLHSQNEAQASRLEEMETELAHVHQELDDLQSQCEDKDAQLRALNGQLKEADTLTQDVMRDLHNVKLDISNYASLVSQQQLELISERARHSDEAREKDEELSNLQTQLNQERQNWMMEMNHKQAEIVVARVLSEKMRLKNKTLATEYKRLKADYGGKKRKLKILEQQLTQLTTDTRRFSIGTESEADFDEVKQFQALLAQANDHERAQKK